MDTSTLRAHWIALCCLIAVLTAPMCFGDSADAPQTQRQYLSGIDKDHTQAWQFFCDAGQNSGKWTTIAVPSNWELQGFGIYTYGADINALKRRAASQPGEKTNYELPVQGKYKYNFTVPADWAQKKVFLVFDGSMTDTQVLVNGRSTGPIHRGGYYRFRFD